MAEHIFGGSCPDETQPDARDANCPACELIVETERLEDRIAALTVERDELKAASDSYRGEAERLRELLDVARDQRDTAEAERDEAIRERDASVCHASALAEHRDRLREELNSVSPAALRFARQDVATLLEAIAAFRSRQVDGRNTIDAYGELFAVADEIAKGTGYKMTSDEPAAVGEVIDELRGLMDTLLAAVGRVTGLRGTTEPWASRLSALHDVANEIAKRTGYAGGQGG